MKKTMLSAAILLSLAGASMSANAAEIQFTGKISAQTCKLSAGDLKMELPTVGISDVADLGQHNGATTVSAPVICEGAIENAGTVTMSLMPIQGSYTANSILVNKAQNDAAKGVGIVVLDKDSKPFNFDLGVANIEAPLVDGKANIQVSATYAKDGSAEITAGDVSAVLPFVMTYQ
ncbi:fimbrial protein [Aeromonas salmonicida]|jgi:type 1 fimbria pilin|uniref:fimbrial protein n=1 Tax=Aeromonas salmonicida TaxID=645 RepID=UPI00223EAF5F|nr:fimbrial protein [Aeromonas salmonicida]MDF8331203.1 fimbrial protein [Aeromonas salmonicida]